MIRRSRWKTEPCSNQVCYVAVMGSGDLQIFAENIRESAASLAELLGRLEGRVPDGLFNRLYPRLSAIVEELEGYRDILTNLDLTAFAEVENQIRPYDLDALLVDPSGSYSAGIVTAFRVTDHKGRILPVPKSVEADEDITIDVYLADESQATNGQVLDAIDVVVRRLGYGEQTDVQTEYGSIFRQSRAKAKKLLSSAEMQEQLALVEQTLQILIYEKKRAEVDGMLAKAFRDIVDGLADQSEACIRIGSLFIVKYQTRSGPVILTRTLSAIEIETLERYPGIQKTPSCALESLALAMRKQAETPDLDALGD
jgi:hypothetical protein